MLTFPFLLVVGEYYQWMLSFVSGLTLGDMKWKETAGIPEKAKKGYEGSSIDIRLSLQTRDVKLLNMNISYK